MAEIIQDHPEWLHVIEADIKLMEQQYGGTGGTTLPHFSDAYLSSVPKKQRRLLSTNPDQVLTLQPDPSKAIANILHRAISNSSSSIESQEIVLKSIADDGELQTAYESYLKQAVAERLNGDANYSDERFANCSKYFK